MSYLYISDQTPTTMALETQMLTTFRQKMAEMSPAEFATLWQQIKEENKHVQGPTAKEFIAGFQAPVVEPRGLKLVAENNGFQVFFDCQQQSYSVFKDGKFLIGDKFKFSDVKTYID